MWDRERLERVLVNLVTNALKYSPEGGAITMSLDRDSQDGSSWAVVRVADSGIGIPPTEIPKVFDRFFRGSNVGGIEGAGIGLSGVRQIAEQHGGSVAVDSVQKRGSTFTVRLPLQPADQEH